MTKKAYIEAHMTFVVEVQPQNMIAGSKTATVDGEQALDYDPTEGDASTGLSRRRKDLWEDEEEEELY